MADSALSKFKDDVANDPATDRLKEELQSYLQARAVKAVSGLGTKLGESVTKFGEGGQGAGGLMGSLAKGGQALSEGKSPAQAAMTAGTSHVKEMVKDKVKGLFGKGKGKSGGGKSKSVTIVEDIDVGVPVREAYDQWTQFQEFSTFAKGVVSVEKSDDVSSNWNVKVAKSKRSLKANVTEQVPDERITWTTSGAKGTVKGVVTFHRITDNLTRVLLVLEYFPGGFFEKTGNIWRAQGRRARLDLKLYRKFIMMRGEATDGWRGEIRDGEVVVEHEDAVEEEERAKAESEESEEPETEDGLAGEDGPADEDDAEDGPEGEYEEELEPEEEYDEDEAEEEYADDEPEGEYEEELEPEEEYEEDEAEDEEEEDERGRRTVSAGR
ncbi:cyclase [Streptomyces abyssalis]|uniref:Cyclase n=1 Tax=Streptomyces abyssalis TaxID=933944 RepID=A0A1E7JUU1_9ACTN|nr:SRPBCC family protein [Streptomyces abyssalis]OEU89328.1 cyclase [Streptomyces abyssalis]OEU93699.1 cyclase [Streptomyces abyssalis]